jgi:hypothetical protein
MRRCWTNAYETRSIKDQCISLDDLEALVIVFRGRQMLFGRFEKSAETASATSRTFQDLVFEEYQRSNRGLPS